MSDKTLIIAEAGVNHNGDLETAKELIAAAKAAGADVVKFQTAKLSSLVAASAPMADYQKENTGVSQSQKEMLAKLLLPFEDFTVLADECRRQGIAFLSTPFDIESIRFLTPLQKVWKVPSGEITNYPYLVQIAGTGMPVILSTGMSELHEIEAAKRVLEENGAGKLTLLHCTTEYPAPLEEVNLRVIPALKARFGCDVGYSDHTRGIEISLAAAALGATVIEKHFTLDRNMPGPDHKASLEPNELAALVKGVRTIEKALGDGVKRPTPSELKNRAVARKSVVAARDIRQGELLTAENLTTKRPGTGVDPMRWNELLGTRAVRDFREDELIEI
jgi:N,N'-diacetyllegionaminate synthase